MKFALTQSYAFNTANECAKHLFHFYKNPEKLDTRKNGWQTCAVNFFILRFPQLLLRIDAIQLSPFFIRHALNGAAVLCVFSTITLVIESTILKCTCTIVASCICTNTTSKVMASVGNRWWYVKVSSNDRWYIIGVLVGNRWCDMMLSGNKWCIKVSGGNRWCVGVYRAVKHSDYYLRMGLPDIMIIRLGQANAWDLLGSTINSIGEAVRLGGLELQGQRLRSSKVLVVTLKNCVLWNTILVQFISKNLLFNLFFFVKLDNINSYKILKFRYNRMWLRLFSSL